LRVRLESISDAAQVDANLFVPTEEVRRRGTRYLSDVPSRVIRTMGIPKGSPDAAIQPLFVHTMSGPLGRRPEAEVLQSPDPALVDLALGWAQAPAGGSPYQREQYLEVEFIPSWVPPMPIPPTPPPNPMLSQPPFPVVTEGLQVSLAAETEGVTPGSLPHFRVELHNTSEKDFSVSLGFICGKQYPSAVLLLVTDAQGQTRRLILRGPGVIAGRVDPFVVPLAAGSRFSIPVNLDDYRYFPMAPSRDFDWKWEPGVYSLQAQFKSNGAPQFNNGSGMIPGLYWTGTITSNSVRFEIQKQ